MVESLQIDFPGVAYTLGAEAFKELVMSYVEASFLELDSQPPGFALSRLH